MTSLTDFFGREIKVNDVIAYPVRRGSDMWLNKLIVTKILTQSVVGKSPSNRLITIHNLRNVVIDIASRSPA